jgi:hypothetical protein
LRRTLLAGRVCADRRRLFAGGQQCCPNSLLHPGAASIQTPFTHAPIYEMSSNIIILCPQTAPTVGNNPNACWGWFDFNRSDPRHAQKNEHQMFAAKRMIDRIAGAE